MTPRRRLSLQLTPLLDLLLIVIFAQYMEVQQTTRAEHDELNRQRRALSTAEQQIEERSRSLQWQLDTVGDRLAATFDLPAETWQQLTRLPQSEDGDHWRQAARRLQSQLAARGERIVQWLVNYDEMDKHVSLWEMHLLANGQAELSDGARQQTFGFSTPAEFEQRALEASKSFAEPKTLVLILLTYGDTQARFRRIAADAMPGLTERLRADSGRTRWYDFSLLGFRPRGSWLPPTPASEITP